MSLSPLFSDLDQDLDRNIVLISWYKRYDNAQTRKSVPFIFIYRNPVTPIA